MRFTSPSGSAVEHGNAQSDSLKAENNGEAPAVTRSCYKWESGVDFVICLKSGTDGLANYQPGLVGAA